VGFFSLPKPHTFLTMYHRPTVAELQHATAHFSDRVVAAVGKAAPSWASLHEEDDWGEVLRAAAKFCEKALCLQPVSSLECVTRIVVACTTKMLCKQCAKEFQSVAWALSEVPEAAAALPLTRLLYTFRLAAVPWADMPWQKLPCMLDHFAERVLRNDRSAGTLTRRLTFLWRFIPPCFDWLHVLAKHASGPQLLQAKMMDVLSTLRNPIAATKSSAYWHSVRRLHCKLLPWETDDDEDSEALFTCCGGNLESTGVLLQDLTAQLMHTDGPEGKLRRGIVLRLAYQVMQARRLQGPPNRTEVTHLANLLHACVVCTGQKPWITGKSFLFLLADYVVDFGYRELSPVFAAVARVLLMTDHLYSIHHKAERYLWKLCTLPWFDKEEYLAPLCAPLRKTCLWLPCIMQHVPVSTTCHLHVSKTFRFKLGACLRKLQGTQDLEWSRHRAAWCASVGRLFYKSSKQLLARA
jgi:hypothetical protein